MASELNALVPPPPPPVQPEVVGGTEGLSEGEAGELWDEFGEVIKSLYVIPFVATKVESKLKRGFMQAAMSSKPELKSWLEKFVKAGRLR